jgi:hypothetical protein
METASGDGGDYLWRKADGYNKGFNKKRKGVDTQLPRNRKVTRSTVQ